MHATKLNMAKCIERKSTSIYEIFLHNLICFCTVFCK
uniref:Uncharacterized protein n=1 Tax=Anguilla anguilla TaxID=7936 RepID=A0A0E9TBP1_ANGAN